MSKTPSLSESTTGITSTGSSLHDCVKKIIEQAKKKTWRILEIFIETFVVKTK
jgi:hypothetical protein